MLRRSFLKLAAMAVVVPALRWTEPLRLKVELARQRVMCYWNGGTGHWHDPAMWRDGRVPRGGDDVWIMSGHVLPGESEVNLNCLRVGGDLTVVGVPEHSTLTEVYLYGGRVTLPTPPILLPR